MAFGVLWTNPDATSPRLYSPDPLISLPEADPVIICKPVLIGEESLQEDEAILKNNAYLAGVSPDKLQKDGVPQFDD